MARRGKGDAEHGMARNPLTGQPPNSFTKVTNRTLPEPTNVREPSRLPRGDRARLRAAHVEATGPGNVSGPQPGYEAPQGMSDRAYGWVTGAHHMFGNEAATNNEPAINEPHEAHPAVTVQRRAEDLSGSEYHKGLVGLANYGHNPRDPMGSLVDVQRQVLHRVVAEHVAAGTEESASQHFYGGQYPHTDIPDPELAGRHEKGMIAAHGRFMDAADMVARHPDFVGVTPEMSHRERFSAATNMVAQATADTSPNSRWRRGEGWPNIEQAEESTLAAVEGRGAVHRHGRKQNTEKAARRVGDMMAGESDTGEPVEKYAPHQYGNPNSAPKTMAFRGAMVHPHSPDAYRVTDVHEAGNMLPGAYTHKGLDYRDAEGKRVIHYADQPESHRRGLEPEITDQGKHKTENSRAEDMLRASRGLVHALNDYAARKVNAEHGLSRGVNYADNVHITQAAAWGSRQVQRTDPQMADVSHASQYPVVRDWAAEGHADIHPSYRHMFPVTNSMSPRFVVNPNTSGVKNPAQQPYPLEK